MSTVHTPPSTYILREMHDVDVPNAIAFFPTTIGWKVLAGIVFLLLGFAAFKAIKHWWVNRYRKEAVSALESIDINDASFDVDAYRILRVVLTHVQPASAGSFGEGFLNDLDSLFEDETKPRFASDLGAKWMRSLEDPKGALRPSQRKRIKQQAVDWVEQHVHAPMESST